NTLKGEIFAPSAMADPVIPSEPITPTSASWRWFELVARTEIRPPNGKYTVVIGRLAASRFFRSSNRTGLRCFVTLATSTAARLAQTGLAAQLSGRDMTRPAYEVGRNFK